MDDFREFLKNLPGKMSAKSIDAIVEYVDAAGPADGIVETVELAYARVPVETVEAYGLSIAVDANGNAVTVSFPAGAQVTS